MFFVKNSGTDHKRGSVPEFSKVDWISLTVLRIRLEFVKKFPTVFVGVAKLFQTFPNFFQNSQNLKFKICLRLDAKH